MPFTKERLEQLYRDHGAYVRAVTTDTGRLVAARFITRADGAEIIREAARADAP